MSLPVVIITLLATFEPVFTQPTWHKAHVLLIGTLLARGRRTVAAALRQTGYAHDSDFSRFHQVLNRAEWSALALSRRLLHLIIARFVAVGGRVTLVIDEHLERRWGPQITKRAHYRDPLRSSKVRSVSTSGLRWVVLAVVIQPPWTHRSWALPFLSILATPEAVSTKAGRRHKTVADLAQQAVRVVRYWLPDVAIELVGDGTYSTLDLGLVCQHAAVSLITPLRLDANLFAPAPPRQPGTKGRPRVKGAALPKLAQVLVDPTTVWQAASVPWYDGRLHRVDWCSGTALWYHSGTAPLAIRWVLVRDNKGVKQARAFLCTDAEREPLEIVRTYLKRWTLEVTFEESRAHLGVETQRQWSDKAIERSTPLLFGLYSLVALFGQELAPTGHLPVQQTAWYEKSAATFSDVLGLVRRELWGNFDFCTSPDHPDMVLMPRAMLDRLAFAVCY
jgi:DDE superfamily endonuclease